MYHTAVTAAKQATTVNDNNDGQFGHVGDAGQLGNAVGLAADAALGVAVVEVEQRLVADDADELWRWAVARLAAAAVGALVSVHEVQPLLLLLSSLSGAVAEVASSVAAAVEGD